MSHYPRRKPVIKSVIGPNGTPFEVVVVPIRRGQSIIHADYVGREGKIVACGATMLTANLDLPAGSEFHPSFFSLPSGRLPAPFAMVECPACLRCFWEDELEVR